MIATMLSMANHPAPALRVAPADRTTLRAIARAPTSQQRAVTRARIILRAGDGVANERIAAELCVALMTVKLWRRRYAQVGLAGLVDEARPGRPPRYTHADRERVIALTLAPPQPGVTHWSARRLGEPPASTLHDVPAGEALGDVRWLRDPAEARRDAAGVADGVGAGLGPAEPALDVAP